MNPYVTDPSLYGQYYPMGQPQHGSPHGAYAAYYNAAYASAQNTAAAAHVVASATGQHPAGPATISAYTAQSRPQIVTQLTHNPQRALTTIHPTPSDSSNNSINPDISATTSTDTSIQNAMASWQQLKQGNTMTTTKSGSSLFPTKTFVKASTASRVGGSSDNAGTTEPNHNIIPSSYDCAEANQICSKLHEVAVLNRLVEVYEKIDCELSPGIHGVRLKLGAEIYQGTGSTYKAAKQNAAATALAQTKYHKPICKPTMKPRPHGVTATQELHELATKKGVEAKFKFLEPFNFEFKSAMRLWSRDEMRGSYKVQLNVSGYEYFGQADLPQQAKHNAAIQALPVLNQLADASAPTKSNVVTGTSSTCGKTGTAAEVSGEGSLDGSVKNVIMALNECAMTNQQCMEWAMVREEGPPHARKFTWSLKMGDYEAHGSGCSKKLAKTEAAQKMYEIIPVEWKIVKPKLKKKKPIKRKSTNSKSTTESIPKKAKEEENVGNRPVYTVIQSTNPISALYEYCRKLKVSDPEFECVSENVLETWQKDNHTFKKTEYTMKLDVNDRTFYSSGNTKKSAKTAAATEAWNVIRIGTM